MEDDPDNSFDKVLAKIDIPPINKNEPKAAKVPRLSSSTENIETDKKPMTIDLKDKEPQNVVAPNAPMIKINAINPHCILVNNKQRGNPLLNSITNCPVQFCDIEPDYVVGRTACVLFLSLKYHNLNRDYICQRLKTLGKQYELRVLLVLVDKPDPHNALKNLTRISLLANLTLMLAWNSNEAGRIIETYKLYEKRTPDSIMERVEDNPQQRLIYALTNVKPVNKTDAMSLIRNFGTLENLIQASEERLALVTGFGQRKARKLYRTLHEPFMIRNKND